jgi:circadian clock protein KaiC
LDKQGSSNHSRRVSTGIPGLDSLLEGGFLPGRCYLVSGDAGTGKTTLTVQFLLSGLRQEEKAVYVTVDERPAEILQSFSALDWDLQSYIDEKKLMILDAAPYFGARAAMAQEKAMDLQRIVADLAGYAKKLEASRLAIDPVTPLITTGASQTRAQEQARFLIHLLQSQLTTTNLLTSHLPSRGSPDTTSGIEEFLAAGVIVLRVDQVGKGFVRTLSVKKMRGTAVKPSEHPFTISKGNGLVLGFNDTQPDIIPEEPVHALEVFQLQKEEN